MSNEQFIYVMKDLRKLVPPKREVLKGIWLSFFHGAKIGVVGPNGSGKSTLLRIMAGLDDDFLGEAWAAKGTRVSYLPQEPRARSRARRPGKRGGSRPRNPWAPQAVRGNQHGVR